MTWTIRSAPLILAGLFWAATATAAQAAAQTGQPHEAEILVQETSDKMLALIDEAKGYVAEDPERFYLAVEALLSSVVDFRRFAGSVMASYYKKATPEQRARFADSFKWALVRTYGLALTEFDGGKIVLVPATKPPRGPDRMSVKMEIQTATGQIYPVVYSMRKGKKDGVWRMRNIIVNGINMGLTYRSQFLSAAQDPQYLGEQGKVDLDKVIDTWTDGLSAEATEIAQEAQAGGMTTSQ